MRQGQYNLAPREYAPRPCACGTGHTFTPRHWQQRYAPECARARDEARWKAKSRRQIQTAPRVPDRPKKPLIGATAPDFLRALRELQQEFARVDINRYDIVRRPVRRQERSA